MPNSYKHLSQDEREIIANMLSGGSSLGEIARAVGRDRSTISRELGDIGDVVSYVSLHLTGCTDSPTLSPCPAKHV